MDSPTQRSLELQCPILSMIRMQYYCAFITAIYCTVGVAGNYSEIPQSALDQLLPFAAFVMRLLTTCRCTFSYQVGRAANTPSSPTPRTTDDWITSR